MVTDTEDHSDRLSALEASVTDLRADFRVHAAETATRLTTLETAVSEMRADVRQINDRIDRVFYTIIGFGSALVLTMLGMIITLILKL